VDEFAPLTRVPCGLLRARRGLAEELRGYFAGFAIIVSYLYDPDGIFQANVVAVRRRSSLPAASPE
jgi:hypothetical protein